MQTYFESKGHSGRLKLVLLLGGGFFVLVFMTSLFLAYDAVNAMEPGDRIMVGGALQLLQVTKVASGGGFVLELALRFGLPGLLVFSMMGAYTAVALAERIRAKG